MKEKQQKSEKKSKQDSKGETKMTKSEFMYMSYSAEVARLAEEAYKKIEELKQSSMEIAALYVSHFDNPEVSISMDTVDEVMQIVSYNLHYIEKLQDELIDDLKKNRDFYSKNNEAAFNKAIEMKRKTINAYNNIISIEV